MLVWRSTAMPDEILREQELNKFRQSLVDVLDWDTAHYDTGKVVMRM